MDELMKFMQPATTVKLIRGQVISLDEERLTVDVQPDDNEAAPLLQVACNVLQDGTGNGVFVLPENGANVLVVAIGNEYYMLQTDKVKKVWMSTEGVSMEMGEFIALNDAEEGIPMLPKLREEIDKINAFLEEIRQVFNSWTPVPNDGGAALKAQMTSALSGLQLADLSNEQVGNPKVKQ